MYHFFYVESPLQLLSAISAVNKFNYKKTILIVNLSSGDRLENDTQLLKLVGSKWGKVYIHKGNKVKLLHHIITAYRVFIKFLKYRKRIDRFFFGEYRNIDMAIMASILSPQERVLLDDGSFTITAQNYYIKNKISPFSHSIKYKLFKPFFKNVHVPNLYSFFQFDLDESTNQKNYFEPPKKRDIAFIKDQVYFFGSKFYESGNMILKDELQVLANTLKVYKDYQVFYIPHRDESSAKLKHISQLGYVVRKFNQPAELFFETTENMPGIVISYYSTVLYSCYLTFNNIKLHTIDVTSLLLIENSKINAKEIYKYYNEIGIKSLKL